MKPNCPRFPRRSLALVACAVAAGGASAAGASPSAHAARTCSPPHYPGLGYFTSLNVSGTDCRTGNKVIIAYYHCRTRSTKAGSCHSSVLGYACHVNKRNATSIEIDARVTCTKRHATVVHTYQQDI